MTTGVDTVLFAPPTRRKPVALYVAVGVVVAAGWVVYRHYWLNDLAARMIRWTVIDGHFWAYSLVLAMLMCLPYALVLLLWGHGLGRAAAGAGIAVAAGLYLWGVDHVFQSYVWDSRSVTATSVRVYDWAILLGVATLVPLAWGVARRSGRAWIVGLLVGPAVAAGLREFQLRSSWWQQRVEFDRHSYHWVVEAVVYVAPFVLAVVACWAIEARNGVVRPSE
jgi:hypothetical protein